jgi:hypothetical protein
MKELTSRNNNNPYTVYITLSMIFGDSLPPIIVLILAIVLLPLDPSARLYNCTAQDGGKLST